MAGAVLACVCGFVAASLRWPLVGDATLLHYCVFLQRHGFAPYRQLVDPNMPGTYFVEWLLTGVWGYGALAWRCFDLLLLLLLTGAAWAFAEGRVQPGDETAASWLRKGFAAVWAGGLFALLHGRDGIPQLGQRDLLMTALLGCAAVSLLRAARVADRRAELAWVAAFGLLLGAAATVKPLAVLLLPVWLGVFAIHARRPAAALVARRVARRVGGGVRERWAPLGELGVLALLGAALPSLACVLWLAHFHALAAFWGVVHGLLPLHSSLFRRSTGHLLATVVPSPLLPVFALALLPVVATRPWRSLPGALLLSGFAFGVFSYWAQGRGYPYHRYPAEWCLLVLWARVLIPAQAPAPRLVRVCAVLALGYGAFVVAPRSLADTRSFTPTVDTQGVALRAALGRLGGPQLSGHVQCLDMAGGCVTTLLRMRLLQSTGFLYDCYALAPVAPRFRGEQDRYRAAWMGALAADPPAVIVAFSDECGPPDERYTVLQRWGELASLLQHSYRLEEQWTPTEPQRWMGASALPYGFRVYTLRASIGK